MGESMALDQRVIHTPVVQVYSMAGAGTLFTT